MSEKMKVTLAEPVLVDEVVVDKIIINPELDIARIEISAGEKGRALNLSGADYVAVISKVDLEAIVALLQPKLSAVAQKLIGGK